MAITILLSIAVSSESDKESKFSHTKANPTVITELD